MISAGIQLFQAPQSPDSFAVAVFCAHLKLKVNVH